ncbi:MAG: hypothetical protein R2727_08640 [Bacteroidales bacterium]
MNLDCTLSELSFTTENFEVTSFFSEIDYNYDHFYLVDPTIKTLKQFH